MKTLMVYTSKTGTTEKCEKKLSKLLKNNVKLIDLKNAEKENIDNYDAVILGGYIHAGKAPS